MERTAPPDDISPLDFFTRWVPEAVASDEGRRSKLESTRARIVFELLGDGGGSYTIHIAGCAVKGAQGAVEDPDLRVVVDIDTWRRLNRGEVSAPEALLKRKVKLHGDFLLGLKLHVILG
jgi:putative sterol carrier protein